MRMIGIIPVRMSSERFPGKPLATIAGRPMIRRMIDIVAATKKINPYYVATADDEIIQYCECHGLPYIITASNCQTGTHRVFDSMRQLSNQPDDCVMNIQGDEPLLKPESLDMLASEFVDPHVSIASLCFKPSNRKYLADADCVKVLVGVNGVALYFGRTVKTTFAVYDHFRQHVGVYGFRRDVLAQIATMAPDPDLEQRPWYRRGFNIQMIDLDYETIAVDRPNDIGRVESALADRPK